MERTGMDIARVGSRVKAEFLSSLETVQIKTQGQDNIWALVLNKPTVEIHEGPTNGRSKGDLFRVAIA